MADGTLTGGRTQRVWQSRTYAGSLLRAGRGSKPRLPQEAACSPHFLRQAAEACGGGDRTCSGPPAAPRSWDSKENQCPFQSPSPNSGRSPCVCSRRGHVCGLAGRPSKQQGLEDLTRESVTARANRELVGQGRGQGWTSPHSGRHPMLIALSAAGWSRFIWVKPRPSVPSPRPLAPTSGSHFPSFYGRLSGHTGRRPWKGFSSKAGACGHLGWGCSGGRARGLCLHSPVTTFSYKPLLLPAGPGQSLTTYRSTHSGTNSRTDILWAGLCFVHRCDRERGSLQFIPQMG